MVGQKPHVAAKALAFASAVAVVGAALASCQTQPPAPPPVTTTSAPAATATQVPTAAATPTPPAPTPDEATVMPSSVDGAPVLANDDGTGAFPIGMKLTDFYAKTALLGWTCSPAGTTDPEATISVGKTQFGFYDGQLDSIMINDASIATAKGLRVGDTITKMKKLYGTKYGHETSMSQPAYYYWFSDNTYLQVTVDHNKITTLSIGSTS